MSSNFNTKYVILVPDGMADSAVPELGNRSPLDAADTPWMDRMAAAGRMGLTRTVPSNMEPGSDVANLSILGYSPREVYTGRAPFEAASMGVDLGENDVAFRLNLVTLQANYTIMADHSADHITSDEGAEIIARLAPVAESMGLHLFPGVSYRHLLVWRDGPTDCATVPPHDFPGEPVATRLPSGVGADLLIRMIVKSWKILETHPVNERRIKSGQGPANSVWPWGQGRPPRFKTYEERFGVTGSVVAAVDLMKGIGKYSGLEPLDVAGATGYLDTNYAGKVEAALNSLREKDIVFLHIEAPDETSHSGQVDLKKKAIEDLDARVVGPVLEGLQGFDRWRILLMPDHHTPLAIRTHTADPVPFLLLDSQEWKQASPTASGKFTEEAAQATGRFVDDATKMVEFLLERENLV